MDVYLAVMFQGGPGLLDLARAADRLGFAGVALADHVAVPKGFRSLHPSGENPFDETSDFPDSLTTAAAMAAVTTRLRILTYVYVLPMRDPFSVAKQAANVAMLSGYRLVLGTGAGWLAEEIALLGHDPATRGRRYDEMIEVMRRFWRDGTAEFHGDFYDFGPTGMYPRPEGPIPVWIGGRSPAALRRAARNDGWVGMNYDLPEVWELLGRLAQERRRAADLGLAREPFDTLVIPNSVPSPDLYDDLEAQGVTATVVVLWPPDEQSDAAKVDAMERFAGRFFR